MTDDEINQACTSVLNSLKEFDPKLGKELTKELNGPQFRNLSKNDRKIEKVRLLYKRNPALFQRIYEPINAEWAREPRSPSNFLEILERKLDFLNPYGELTGGNYTTKV